MTDISTIPEGEYSHLTDPLRNKRVTASVCGAILGNSPWMTRDDAMRSLVRDALGAEREFSGNVATAHGQANEAGIILEFQMETGLTVTASKFLVPEDDEGIFGCSPDGLTSDGGGLECKAPYSLRKAEAPAPFKTLAEQPHYRDQCQFSMFVTGRPHWHFMQWCPNDTKREVEYPCEEWRRDNLPVLRQFHAELIATINDPDLAAEHLAPKRVTIDTPEAARMVREYDELSEAIELATERKKDLLADMVALAKERDALIGGRKLTKVEKAGAVSYAKAIRELCPDASLEKWRGKPSQYWTIK